MTTTALRAVEPSCNSRSFPISSELERLTVKANACGRADLVKVLQSDVCGVVINRDHRFDCGRHGNLV